MVVLILVVFASFILPNFSASRNSREVTSFFVALPDLAVFARERAMDDNSTTRIRYDDGNATFTVTEDAQPNSEEEDQILRELAMPSLLTAQAFRQEDENVTTGDWELVFYPDGRSNGGGVEIEDNGRRRSMLVEPDGTIKTDDQPLPAVEDRRWEAGQIEQRAGTTTP